MDDIVSIGIRATALADGAAREEALDTSRSILVQAPAGSGKTELLTMRLLKLLADVDEPEQVLAITFTRAAAAEMRHRVLKRLEEAHPFLEEETPDARNAPSQIAREALRNSNRRGWRLLDQPQRLNIQTIDSLCLQIAHRMPLSARGGGMLQPTDNADPLYRRAARKTIEHLGERDEDLNQAIEALLQLRDGNLADVERLLAQMLRTRDQWGRSFPLSGDVDWQSARERLEAPFQREIARLLAELRSLFHAHPEAVAEFIELAQYACGKSESGASLRRLAALTGLPQAAADSLDHWLCIGDWLMKDKTTPRKYFTRNHGFPPKDKGEKARMVSLIEKLEKVPDFFDILAEARRLPPPRYTDEQWNHLRHIFTALRHAAAELDLVFAEEGKVDFVEASSAAVRVLAGGASDNSSVESGQQLRHLLVDEFQDTSRRQLELISSLLHDWKAGDGRTVFLVGDPMQSIYMFRHAEVELFDLVQKQGLAAGNAPLPVKTLRLTTNFRSNAGVVRPLNAVFTSVFPYGTRPGSAAVDFLPGVPDNLDKPAGAYQLHVAVADAQAAAGVQTSILPGREPSLAEISNQREANEVVEVVRRYLSTIAAAQRGDREFTVAVLGRARSHLVRIAAALRDAEIPFRAVELERLGDRQEILDLQSLTRALLHPMDRIAWLAVLRAPWCGLKLNDLHLLCGTDERTSSQAAVLPQLEDRLGLLSESSRRRVQRVTSALQAALRQRYSSSSFSAWIERTWLGLGGPACVDATGYENAISYFRMLEQVALDGIAATGEAMEDQLDRLFASPDPQVDERCGVQLMTMHKAKGLGFHVVILPGLNRGGGYEAQPLIRYMERETGVGPELLVAPIGSTGEATSPLNAWIRGQNLLRETEERKRLLYVACTRAREELHLFATVTVTKSGAGAICKAGTLLQTAWPALEEIVQARYAEHLACRFDPQPDNVVDFPAAPPEELNHGIVETLAAAAAGGRNVLHRLPLDWTPTPVAPDMAWQRPAAATTNRLAAMETRGERPHGSRTSRLLGTAIHVLLERAGRLFESGATAADIRISLPSLAEAIARNDGLSGPEINSSARAAVAAVETAFGDPYGLWILKARGGAQTESSWTGVTDGAPRELRIDRSFRAGPEPLTEGHDCLWIIDYKTAAHSQSGIEAFLAREREQYAPQLERYATVMRHAHGVDLQLRLGLYYPLLPRLLWWPFPV